ncbi:MAG: PEP-CTERM sorting domain-containing protein [Lentisphaeria bacterium]
MCNKFYWLAIAGALIGGTLPSEAGWLLSNNPTSGDYPGTVPVLATGATYSWLAGSDADVIAQDPNCTKARDGYSEVAGGNNAVYGTWGATATYTAVFDLQAVYQIEQVAVSTVFTFTNGSADHSAGIGTLTVWTSADGITYGTPWDQLIDPTPINSRNALLSVTGLAPVDARYVRVELDRIGSPGNTWYMQARTGEIAIFGAVPEPATLGLLGLGGLILLRRRR